MGDLFYKCHVKYALLVVVYGNSKKSLDHDDV